MKPVYLITVFYIFTICGLTGQIQFGPLNKNTELYLKALSADSAIQKESLEKFTVCWLFKTVSLFLKTIIPPGQEILCISYNLPLKVLFLHCWAVLCNSNLY